MKPLKDTLKNSHAQRILGLLGLDILLFTTTNATTAPSFVAIVAFILVVMTIFYVIYSLTGLSKFYGLPIKQRRSLSVYLTIVTGIILALQSTGELGPRDILVILLLAVMGYLYSSYAKTTKRNLDV